jgi:acyl-CoA thioesterase FadM
MLGDQGHVNNVTYVRYAESARVEWARNIAMNVDPANKKEWSTMWTSTGHGMILKSITIDYKFVSCPFFSCKWIEHVY